MQSVSWMIATLSVKLLQQLLFGPHLGTQPPEIQKNANVQCSYKPVTHTCGRSGSKKSSGTHSGTLSFSCWVMTYTLRVNGKEQRVLKPTSALILKLGVRRLRQASCR